MRPAGADWRAIVRVNLRSHGGITKSGFASFIARTLKIRAAFSTSLDAGLLSSICATRTRELCTLQHGTFVLPHETCSAVGRERLCLETAQSTPRALDLAQLSYIRRASH